jgi:RNA polymerase sigma-70 factor (ECF subfamily)
MHPWPEGPASAELDDVTLVRAKRGEPQALAQLVARYQTTVWAYLWRMLGPAASRPVVEDLFQETFLGVHRALGRFTPAGPARLSTWILAIATRTVLYRQRTLGRERPVARAGAEPHDGGDQAEGIERRVLVRALMAALAALSPEHRAIVILRDFHELEYEEIARVLDLELGTVRSRLSRARESLRRAMEQEGGGR